MARNGPFCLKTIQNILNYGINAGYLFFATLIVIISTVNIKFIRYYLLNLKKMII